MHVAPEPVPFHFPHLDRTGYVFLNLAYIAVATALASALVSLPADRLPGLLRSGAFILLAVSGACAAGAGVGALYTGQALHQVLPFGLPWLHWHLQLDPLSGAFLTIIGTVTFAVSLYGPAYVREYQHGQYSLALLGLCTGLFITGMLLVVLAADAFAFMVAWELMSLASYFLVAYQHHNAANRRAAFLYLLMAHISGVLILLAYGVLAGFAGDFTFSALAHATVPPFWASVAFTLALLGFGMKAGMAPLHVWLPEAHPVAPSHISALMSGVMLKVALYGLLRFTFGLLGAVHWGWGLAMMVLGAVSALIGVLYAYQQSDLKRLLAYSSVENMGIIFMAAGLAAIFLGTGHPTLAALGLVATLYHALNHAMFKSLLFLGAGAIVQSTHERNLERLGGLIHRLPQTAALFLVGSLAIAALPPLNGFVSEWLTFQAALQSTHLGSGVLRSIVPIAAAMLALTAAIGAAAFVKVYGVAFLGRPRTRHARAAREVHAGMRFGMLLLALFCVLLGIFPTAIVALLQNIPLHLIGAALPSAAAGGWLWLTPVSPQTASYAALLVLAGLAGAWLISFALLHPRRRKQPIRRTRPWDCGFGPLNARMQYTATSFSMPLRRVFQPVWALQESVETRADSTQPPQLQAMRYRLQVSDRSWNLFYEPVARLVQRAARWVSRMQTGSIRAYLTYSFLTLLLLLWLIT
jgi:hydrogenase-4 component B